MARITVEDCLDNVENRFELVILAAKRARQLAMTAADPYVPWNNDKSTVVALREIAAGYTRFDESSRAEARSHEVPSTQLHEHPHEADAGGDMDSDDDEQGTETAA